MYVSFKKIKFKNILSYGNAWTEFEFKPGMNIIKAQNGSGKSAIIDAITFVLFGKPYRDIKMAQLINNINEANLVVVINFTIGADEYEMTRGLKPNIFSLKKNGETLDLLSSKKLNQSEIDKIIGIDYNLYKNIVCVASINNKSFLSLPPQEKRLLIESIFNINVLALMLTEVKKQNTINKTKQKTSLATYDGLIDNIRTTTIFYEDVSKKKRTFIEDKTKKIADKRLEIDNLAADLLSYEKNIGIGNKKEIEFAERLKELPGILSEKNELQVNIKSITKEIDDNKRKVERILSGGSICPLCGSELCNEHAVAYRADLQDKILKSEKALDEFNSSFSNISSKELELNKLNNTLGILRIKNVEQKAKKEKVIENIKNIEEQITELVNSEFTIDLASYKNKLTELEERRTIVKNELDGLEKEMALESYLMKTLGEYGVRQYFFNKLLPILNAKVNNYLNLFELPISLEFDNTLNAKITRGRYEMNYEQFSCGEKQRIDMSILLSFFDISKSISNWSCSVLFLDEILDSGVDSSGLTNFISVLNNIVHSNTEEDLGVYLISHKLADSSVNFDNVIEITKKALFSQINYVEKN